MSTLKTAEEAKAAGFATFNSCEHFCIALEEGWSTISVKTPDGKLVTFAFVPTPDGKSHQCVDIAYHNRGTTAPGRPEIPTFGASLRNGGSLLAANNDVTLAILSLK